MFLHRTNKQWQFFAIALLHPTEFDAPSIEAFRVARELAQQLGAKVIVFMSWCFLPVTADGQ